MRGLIINFGDRLLDADNTSVLQQKFKQIVRNFFYRFYRTLCDNNLVNEYCQFYLGPVVLRKESFARLF